jgi:hypothetical protein
MITDNLIKMSFEDWCNEYQPVINHIDPYASFDDGNGGVMFETYGPELNFVLNCAKATPLHVWTYMDGKNSALVTEGYHLVNRIGYFITANPAKENIGYEINLLA